VANWTKLAENVANGLNDPEQVVVAWILDYGVTNKVDRVNIMDSHFDSIGIGVSNSDVSPQTVVVNFATNFNCLSTKCPNVPSKDVGYHCTANPYTYGGSTALKMGLVSLGGLLMVIWV